jgi:transmembrane sensor
MKNPIDFGLLDRVLSGEATSEERAQLEQLAAEDDELRQLLAELPRAVRAGGAYAWDTEEAWARMAKAAARGDYGPVRGARWRLAVSAAILVLGLGAVYTFNYWRGRAAREALAASQIHRTAVGERRTVKLADGSTVVLAPLSELRVSTDPARAREVQLEGQAFFDVVPDPGHVFTVLTRNATTRVLGTSFMVSEYRTDRAAEVLVVSGRVALGSRRTGQSPTVLERGQSARISEDGALIVRASNDVSERIAWTQGRLVFRGERFADLVPALARWYGADIRLADDALGDTRVTALFEGQTLDEVLEVLAETVGARYTRAGNQITFSK